MVAYGLESLPLTKYPDLMPAFETGLTGADGITPLQLAIAERNTAHADILLIGDSNTEGQGATAFGNRAVAQANRAIRAAYPTTANGASGGLGFIPFGSTGETSFTWPITLASGSLGDILDLGPVRRSTGFTTSTAVWTFTAPAGTTGVRVCYYDGSAPGGFTYQVNAGTVNTVDNTGVLLDAHTSVIPMTAGDVLTISATGSANCFITGIIHYAGDENSGITIHGCGHYGWTSGTQVNGWNQAETFALNWAQAFINSFPNTVALAIMLGINDADAGDGNRTGPQFQSDMQGLLDTIRGADPALSTMPILLIPEFSPGITVADPQGWPAYVAALRGLQAADTNTRVTADLSYRLPPVGADWQGGVLYSDNYHWSDAGSRLAGEIIAAGMRIA